MPVIKVNLGDVQSTLGAGNWLVELENISQGKTRRSQDDMLRFRTRCVEPEESKGRAYFENAVLTEDSVWVLDRMLRGLGVDVPEDKAARAAFEFDPEELINRQCVLVVRSNASEEFPNSVQTSAVLTVEQAEAQGIVYGPFVEDDDEDED